MKRRRTQRTRSSPGFRRLTRIVSGLGVFLIIAAIVAFLMAWRARIVIEQLFQDWATNAVATKSDSTYRLVVGRTHISWVPRRFTVASLELFTDRRRNAARASPLPDLHIVLKNCAAARVDLLDVIRGRGLHMTEFGCFSADVQGTIRRDTTVAVVSNTPASTNRGFLVLQHGIQLPRFAPSIRVGRLAFPKVRLDLHVPGARSGETSLRLQLQWRMSNLAMESADTSSASRPLFSRSVDLATDDLVFHPDSIREIHVARLRTSLTDSSLDIEGVRFAPSLSDSAFMRLLPYRRSRVRLKAARIAIRGVDFGALATGRGDQARRIDVDSLNIDVYTDKHLPPRPVPKHHEYPQRWIAGIQSAVYVDSVAIRSGMILYTEVRPEHDDPGVLTFTRLTGLATHVDHGARGRPASQPMTLATSAYLMGAGQLKATFEVPLDAPRFAMTFHGSLSAMPAKPLDRIVAGILPMRISRGDITEIRFAAVVTNGTARGTITPLYNDLGIEVVSVGRSGLLGSGGILGRVARSIATFGANQFKLYPANPENSSKPPRVGAIDHVFDPKETIIGFVWFSLRDGLLQVIKR